MQLLAQALVVLFSLSIRTTSAAAKSVRDLLSYTIQAEVVSYKISESLIVTALAMRSNCEPLFYFILFIFLFSVGVKVVSAKLFNVSGVVNYRQRCIKFHCNSFGNAARFEGTNAASLSSMLSDLAFPTIS